MHTIFDPACKSCQQLQAKWYKLLDPSKEIEDIKILKNQVVHSDNLKVWHNHYFFQRHTPEKIRATTEYYVRASALTHTYQFPNATYRKIWEEHAKGMSKREIVKILAKDKRLKQYKATRVLEIITLIKKDL